MDRLCNYYTTFKVNGFYALKTVEKLYDLSNKVNFCDTIYMVNTQQTLKKLKGSHLSNVPKTLKTSQKPDSFSSHYKITFNLLCHDTTNVHSWCSIYKKTFGEMKKSTKPNFNLCMEEYIKPLKDIYDNCVTLMKNTLRYERPDVTI